MKKAKIFNLMQETGESLLSLGALEIRTPGITAIPDFNVSRFSLCENNVKYNPELYEFADDTDLLYINKLISKQDLKGLLEFIAGVSLCDETVQQLRTIAPAIVSGIGENTRSLLDQIYETIDQKDALGEALVVSMRENEKYYRV